MAGDFDPKAFGDEGERRVREELDRLSLLYGFVVFHDQLLGVGKVKSQVDHIVVDRFGVLLTETKHWVGLVMGMDDEDEWTLCHRDKSRSKHRNPLRQSRHHETDVRRLFKKEGLDLTPDLFDSLVVFVETNWSGLSLKTENQARITSLADLENHFASVRPSRSASRLLSVDEVNQLSDLIVTNNRSTNADDVRNHARHYGYQPQARPAPGLPGSPPVLVPDSARRRYYTPEPLVAREGRRAWLPALLLCAVGASVLAVAWTLTHGSWWFWLAVLMAACMLLQAATPRQRRKARRGPSNARVSTAGPSRSAGNRLAALLLQLGLIAAVMLFLLGGGLQWVLDFAMRGVAAQAQSQAPAANTAPGRPALPMLSVAKLRLREIAPEVYKKAANLDAPKVKQSGNTTTYTWEYVVRTQANAAHVKWFALTLDDSGVVVGVNGP